MVARGDIVWADLGPPAGRRPVCIVTRDVGIEVLRSVTCAPLTRAIRGIRSEVPVGEREGLRDDCVISCDGIVTVARSVLDPRPIGRLDAVQRIALDRALRYSLGILH